MISLGIESTAHTFGVGIVTDKGKVLANVKDSYSTKTGGMIPVKMGEHHIEVCDRVLKEALEKAGIKQEDIDVISFSISPGIGHALRIGAVTARTLALKLKKPLVGVNHCIAHLEIGRMLFPECKDPVLLYVSGANTQVIAYDGGKYRIFGETLDNGAGNLLDSFARFTGLGFPGGPKIEELAKKGKKYIQLPYAVKGMDVSFGGLLTNLKNKYKTRKYKVEDLAFSLQETIFSMLVETAERAMAHCEKNELLLGGGVACNKRLQEMCRIMCQERDAKLYCPENQFLVDNGAMIAWTGLLMHKAGISIKVEDSAVRPYERTDDVLVSWRN
ncbi:bifunctional N(6)-L-threonylcarbamoyladenine synthase/serine/threonine protein kinase [Candidatus Woesearchaeota archaeon]|nr:bifunctional N(6)-L-threonylcarbamoyladenine synthase/serine/threonine protein kinase [Candidatus Woesearchaeota archaeon]